MQELVGPDGVGIGAVEAANAPHGAQAQRPLGCLGHCRGRGVGHAVHHPVPLRPAVDGEGEIFNVQLLKGDVRRRLAQTVEEARHPYLVFVPPQ